MAAFTAAVRNAQIDWLNGVANPAAVAGRFITIFNGDPQAGGTEVIATVTGSANRQPITAKMSAASGGSSSNTSIITFTGSAVGVATVNFLAIMDAITGGNVMASGPCTPKTPGIGDGLVIPIGNLTVNIT